MESRTVGFESLALNEVSRLLRHETRESQRPSTEELSDEAAAGIGEKLKTPASEPEARGSARPQL